MTTDLPPGWPVTTADLAGLLRKYQLLAAWRRIRDASAAVVGIAPGALGASHRLLRVPVPGEAGEPVGAPARAALRALSLEFPGALRELDALGLPELERRAAFLTSTLGEDAPLARSGIPAPLASGDWVAWVLAYHGTMRAALMAKRAAGRSRRIPADALEKLAVDAGAVAGVPVDVGFLRAAAHPPGGRLTVLVLGAVAERFGVRAALIAATLFPTRRLSPYRLAPSR